MEKKAKSITVTQYDYIIRNVNDEEVDIQGHPNHYSEYDHDGRPLKEIKYNRLGEFEEMLEYGYDDKGDLVRESYYPSENELAEEKTFFRDDSGRILYLLKKYQDGSVDTITSEYNESGELIKRTTTSDEDEIDQVEHFEWENGVVVNHEILDENGELISESDENNLKPNQTRITQNDKGQVITEEELDENGEVYMTVNRTFNEDGTTHEVDVFIDGQGRAISRHYFLNYQYTFFE